MTGIFISYRREDSGPYAGRLYDALVTHFDRESVFFDIDTISPGEDFREVIQRTCASCEVLLAVIGKQWATVQDKTGKRRLENKNDTLRVEIASALQKGLRVIPVLVGGAEMPDESVLPEDLQALAYRNAWDVSDKRFHHDIELLADALKRASRSSVPQKPSKSAPVKKRNGIRQRASGSNVGKTSRDAPQSVRPEKSVLRDATTIPSHRGRSLFPIHGIVLGKTPVSELVKKGERSTSINERTGEPYACYDVNGLDFWYDESSKIADSIFETSSDNIPEPWVKLGFRWGNSYNQWLSWLEDMGYSIEVVKEPQIEEYDGHDSFTAEVIGRIGGLYPHKIDLDFSMSKGTTAKSTGTLFSVDIAYEHDEEVDEGVGFDDDDESSSQASLFPIYGIVLGETSTREIAKIGHRTKTIDKSTRKPYHCYEVNGADFWYDETSNIVTRIRLTTGLHPMPKPWQELGFRYQNSYDQWLSLLKNMGYSIEVEEEPRIEQWDGHASFSAKVVARKKGLYPHEIELDFSYSRGTTTSSSNTLYGMGIRIAD